MSDHATATPAASLQTDEILAIAEVLGDIKTRFERVESEFSTQSKPMEAALGALNAALVGLKTLQVHVLDNNLGALSVKVEEQRRAIDEQVTSIVGELKKADEQAALKTAETATELRRELFSLENKIGAIGKQFTSELGRIELEARKFAEATPAIAGPAGPAGASLNPTGSYAADKAYSRLDVVAYLGSSYVSNIDENREKPGAKSANWTMIAARGAGAPGGGSGDITGLTGTLKPSQIASGTNAFAVGDVLYANTTGTLTPLAASTAGHFLQTQGGGVAPQWAAASGSGLGDFSGPASSTDNALVRFDGTGGKNGQNSGITVSDTNNMTVAGTGLSAFAGQVSVDAGSAIPSLQILNTATDKPLIGFYRAGTLRGVFQLFGNSDFRVYAEDLSTLADFTAKVGSFDAIAAAPTLQIKNSSTDAPYIGFYRGGTIRSALQLATDNDFRLYSSDLTTYAALSVASLSAYAGTAIPAGGTTGAGLKVSSTANFGVFFGSGAPTLSAAKGSLYLRSDGSGTSDRAYINTDGGTTWTALATAA